jgi:hypothetical protein
MPTALPSKPSFNGSTVTEAQFKIAMDALNDYLTGLFGSTGIAADAVAALVLDRLPQNSQSANYTLVLADGQKHLLHPATDNNARTFTIPANASVAFPVGTMIPIFNKINTVTIAITTDTLTLSGTALTGSRTLAANGQATLFKISATEWFISGVGIS